MTKLELMDTLAARLPQFSRVDADVTVRLILERMTAVLAAGGRIEIRDFGRFEARHRPARVGRNPKTGEKVSVPSKTVLHFKPGKGLCEDVDRGWKAPQAAPRFAGRPGGTDAPQKREAGTGAI